MTTKPIIASSSETKGATAKEAKLPTTITHLECSRCKKTHPHTKLLNLCDCGGPLLARYDLKAAARTLTREALRGRATNMWRYAEILPAREAVTLGEGMTPLLHAKRLGESLGLRNLYIKDEGLNPTGSFKARGLSAAVSRAKELGAKALATPTAGNAGGALAAYAAKAGIPCVIVMPADTPLANEMECRAFGADVRKLDGLISDCGKYVAENKDQNGWYEVTTLKEPYRVEGKKTMAYELWEQFEGKLPDVIIYPTGGGVGMIGMWKALEEMEAMGWIGRERPRMVTVQAAGCAPIVDAFEKGIESAPMWEHAATIASGLRVPKAIGDFLILRAIRESKGTAVAAPDDEILATGRELAAKEGMYAAPEGAATVVAARKLAAKKWIAPDETVVLYNTGSGYKYNEAWQAALKGK
ncbi:MAG TPA: threonine synthase [Candidatus Acidoferrales bacterium]|nr:threonine synthase [Candidatus Acidoferrales bacterium]